jgi:enoyl-CoA hydratase/carnithine racemase
MTLVLTEHDGAVLTLTLNRPERKNALTVGLLEELCAALDDAARSRGTRAIILRGAGSSFSTGFDLMEAQDLDASLKHGELLVRAQLALADPAHPVTIAAVHGFCLAGGGALVAACDYAVCTADAQFGYPVLKSGLVPTPGMPFLRHELRERDFRALVLSGDLIDGSRAVEIGLVNNAFSTAEEVFAEASRFARKILQSSPVALATTKLFASELTRGSLREEMNAALDAYRTMRRHAEAAEGLRAFAEKRPPNWTK